MGEEMKTGPLDSIIPASHAFRDDELTSRTTILVESSIIANSSRLAGVHHFAAAAMV